MRESIALPDKLHFRAGFPTNEGFFGRECNSPECCRYFKVHEDSIKPHMHCLYCGEEFPNDQLWTRDQLQYMGRVVEHEVTPLIQKELNEMLRRAFSSLRSPLVAGERQDVRPEKKGGVMRLHGLLVYASFIGFWVAIIPSPSYAQSLAERYESTRRTDFHTAITQALVANNVRGCGEYKYRESRTDEGEYLVYCTQDGKTWTAYLVWASIKKIMGPYPPDPSIK